MLIAFSGFGDTFRREASRAALKLHPPLSAPFHSFPCSAHTPCPLASELSIAFVFVFLLCLSSMKAATAHALHPRPASAITRPPSEPKPRGLVAYINPPPEHFDPFLYLSHRDYDIPANSRDGFPPHPHRGFETVTYVPEGVVDHGDSRGNKGRYGNGDAQWMSAGKGVLHSEMFLSHRDRTTHLLGFQLWLNLPAKLKMTDPEYLMLWKKDIPVVEEDGTTVRIIAGSYGGKKSVVQKSIPLSYLHVTLPPGRSFSFPVPPTHNCLLHLFRGSALRVPSTGQEIPTLNYALFAPDAAKPYDSVEVRNDAPAGAPPADFLFLEGKPLREPVARKGPFVMNTQAEIAQAFEDYSNGLFGELAASDPQPLHDEL